MQSAWFTAAAMAAYFLLLLLVSRLGQKNDDNATFYKAQRKAPWKLVAIGMIAGSISGVSFISVPGWVGSTGMSYLQMCMGFIVGYWVVAFVLLPVYYRLQLTSIYTYLQQRFGNVSHRTGAAFFLLSKLTGATVRLYLATLVVQTFIAAPLGISYPLTIGLTLLLIWFYTQRSGQGGLLYTDVVQTIAMLLALMGIMVVVMNELNLSLAGAWNVIQESPMSYVLEWNTKSPQAFWKQFLSGIFIVIVMTGLDQDMMQKNLTCKDLKSAQKDMCTYGIAFLPINALFLALGILLHQVCAVQQLSPPTKGDELLPWLVSCGHLGSWAILPFSIGICAAAFSAADGAITSLTTSTCVDLFRQEENVRLRRWVHGLVVLLCYLCILGFHNLGSGNVIHAIYRLASYTYAPLLGLFAFGLFTHQRVRDKWVPLICVLAPVMGGALEWWTKAKWNYTIGYELLMINGVLTMIGLWIISSQKKRGEAKDGKRVCEI